MRRILALIPLLCTAIGCSLTESRLPALAALSDVEIDYAGRITTEDMPETRELEWTAADPDARESCGTSIILVRVDGATGRDLLGEQVPGATGRILGAAESQRLRSLFPSGSEALLLDEATLSLASGQKGYIGVQHEMAYIKEFALLAVHGAAIADPIIGKADTGVQAQVECIFDSESGPFELAIRLHKASVDRPIAVTELPGLTTFSMQVQTPVFAHVEMSARTVLERGQSLLMIGPEAGRSDSFLMALVTATGSTRIRT